MSDGMQHEDLSRAHLAEGGSDRSFGVVFCIVFSVIGLWPSLGGGAPRGWALGAAIALLGVTILKPKRLAPLNRLWTRFGILLGNIISPIMLAIVYYLAVTPTALVMRLIGRDLLSRSFDESKASYWIDRKPPVPGSMKNQF